ncbi:MAG: hypothetical protein RH862_18045 [Leptospiraceae bacterium]
MRTVHPASLETIQQAMDLAAQGKMEPAEYFLLRAHEIDPSSSVGCVLGWFYAQQMKDQAKGDHYLFKAVLQDRRNATSTLELAVYLYETHRLDRACAWFYRCLRCPDKKVHPVALYFLARIYQQWNRPERSLRYLNLALKLKPDFEAANRFLNRLKKSGLAENYTSNDSNPGQIRF